MSYVLEYKESGASSWGVGAGGVVLGDYFTGNSFTISSLNNGTTYDIRVSALNLHGQSATTDPVLQETTDTVP